MSPKTMNKTLAIQSPSKCLKREHLITEHKEQKIDFL